jgi:hypothetical protein
VINSSSTTLDHISGQGPAVLREGDSVPPYPPGLPRFKPAWMHKSSCRRCTEVVDAEDRPRATNSFATLSHRVSMHRPQ